MKKLLWILLLALLLTAASVAGAETKTTIMVYMSGSDISDDALSDVAEMYEGLHGDSVTVTLLAGGSSRWADLFSPRKLNRCVLADGQIQKLETLSNRNMGKSDTVVDFLDWSVSGYPADRYMLIFWDHGGGSASGVCWDETNSSDYLSLQEIYQALQTYSGKHPGFHLDWIGFDACLMASYETAAHVAPFADYFIASEELEPGYGWYYQGWLQALCANPEMDSQSVAVSIADHFARFCLREEPSTYVSMSVTYLPAMAGLIEKMETFADSLVQALSSGDLSSLTRARSRMYSFGSFYDYSSDCVDLMAFINAAQEIAPQAAEEILTAYQQAVRYSIGSKQYDYLTGLSVFFPDSRKDLQEVEMSSAVIPKQIEFFKNYASRGNGQSWSFDQYTPSCVGCDDAQSMPYNSSSSWGNWWDDGGSSWGNWGYGDDGYGGYGWGYNDGPGYGYDGYGWGNNWGYESGPGYGYDGYGWGDEDETSWPWSDSSGNESDSAPDGNGSSGFWSLWGLFGDGQGSSSNNNGSQNSWPWGNGTGSGQGNAQGIGTGEFTEYINNTEASETAESPENTAGPENAENPENTVSPMNTEIPEAPGNPENTVSPENTETLGNQENAVIQIGPIVPQSAAAIQPMEWNNPMGGYTITIAAKELPYLAGARGMIFANESDEEMFFLLELGAYQNVSIDWEQGTVTSLFDGTLPFIGDQPVAMYDVINTTQVRRSVIPVRYHGKDGYLILYRTPANPDWVIAGFSEGYDENGMPARGATQLAEGEIITPLYETYGMLWEDEEMTELVIEGDPITVGEGGQLSLEFLDLTEGEGKLQYMFSFQFTDIYGEIQISDLVDFEM